MPKVFTGKVAIPGDKINEYFAALKKAEEERLPFRNELTALNHAFAEHLAEKFSERTARKHSLIIEMFVEFLCGYTDVWKLEEVTVGMANSHFQTWYRRKVMDSTQDNDRKVAIGKFFQFLAEQKGIVNAKVLASFAKSTGQWVSPSSGAEPAGQVVPGGQPTVVLRVKLIRNKRVYRDLELPTNQTLYALAEAIVRAFNFDFDHPFGFYATEDPRKHYVASARYELFTDLKTEPTPGAKGVKRTKIASAITTVGQKMLFLFDYGDEWFFLLEVMRFRSKVAGAPYPRTLLSRGAAPEQYPD